MSDLTWMCASDLRREVERLRDLVEDVWTLASDPGVHPADACVRIASTCLVEMSRPGGRHG